MNFSNRSLASKNLNPLGLGCMSLSWGYQPRPDEAYGEKLLNKAIDLGVDHFDTARLYGLGHNEKILSRVLNTRRKEVFLASKCGIEFDDGGRRIDCKPETIRKAVETSLKTLNVEHIDLYYLHRRDFTVPIEESVGTLAALQNEGKIGAIGLSEMSSETLRKAYAETPIAAMQTEYSLWTRNPELGVLETCKDLGTAFVAFSPVGRGALAGAVSDVNAIPDGDLRKKHPRFNAENWPNNLKLINEFNALAGQAGVTPAQLSLAWVLSRGEHVHVIPGTGSIQHLQENLETKSLSSEILEKAGDLINHEKIAGHRYPDAMRKTIDTEDFS